MSVIELKQNLSRLKPRERREIQIYLHQLSRNTPAWRKATAKKISAVKAGKLVTLAQLEVIHQRG